MNGAFRTLADYEPELYDRLEALAEMPATDWDFVPADPAPTWDELIAL